MDVKEYNQKRQALNRQWDSLIELSGTIGNGIITGAYGDDAIPRQWLQGVQAKIDDTRRQLDRLNKEFLQ